MAAYLDTTTSDVGSRWIIRHFRTKLSDGSIVARSKCLLSQRNDAIEPSGRNRGSIERALQRFMARSGHSIDPGDRIQQIESAKP
jgi:hypothetical protein